MLDDMRDDDVEGPYTDLAKVGFLHDHPDQAFHYARVVIDHAANRAEVKGRCAGMLDYYTPTGDALSCVYVIRAVGRDHCKIGYTNWPKSRIEGIQASNWDRLEYAFTIWVWDGNGKAVEQTALKTLRALGAELRGEWVEMDTEAAFDIVLDAAKTVGAECADLYCLQETNKQMMFCGQQVRQRLEREALQRKLGMAA